LFDFFPKRVGSPTMRRIGCNAGKVYGAAMVRKIRDEMPLRFDLPLKGDIAEHWGNLFSERSEPAEIVTEPNAYDGSAFLEVARTASLSLPDHLTRLCLDPDIELANPSCSAHGGGAGVWYFDDLVDALKRYLRHCADSGLEGLAITEISDQIYETLDFCYRQRRMVLIEGAAGIGKTLTVKAWCNRYPGLVRHVELPSSNDDRSFYAAIAEAVGVARGSAYNGQQIKLKVEEALRSSGLMLVLDEGQFAWPQKYNRPQGVPVRMQWIKTAFDAGTPIALVALPEFSDWQALYVKKTLWRDNQLVRRLNRTTRLPASHSKADLIKIAKAIHPGGDEASWKLLAGCALALPKKQASAISETFISARDIAQQDDRDQVTYEDIEAATRFNFEPLEAVPTVHSKGVSAVALNGCCRRFAKGQQTRLRMANSPTF
jgi:AAA domain